jgi:hypothetical protein
MVCSSRGGIVSANIASVLYANAGMEYAADGVTKLGMETIAILSGSTRRGRQGATLAALSMFK